MDYKNLCQGCRRIFRVEVGEGETERLKEAIDFLELDVSPEETQSLARAVGVSGIAASSFLVVVLSLLLGFSILWFLFVAFPVLFFFYLKKYPMLKAESERKKALSQIPEVMSYLIMSLRINPNIEKAVEFSARHAKGLFKRKLEGIMSRIQTNSGGAEDGLTELAEGFSKWDEFKRSMRLVIASTQERTEDRRQDTLDKATEVLLGGLASRTDREARALGTPVMVVFTFGVLLPLIFVAIIPFMSLMGIQVGALALFLIYNIAIPLFLFLLIKLIASNRPITITPPDIPNEGTDKALFVAVAVGLLLSMAALMGKGILGSMEFVPALWGFGTAAGLFLIMTTTRVRKLRKKTKTLEGDFGGTLHQLGIVLSEGRPLEDAMTGVDSVFFNGAARNIGALNTDLRSAFFDERFGSLREVYSNMIKSTVDILVSIADKGSEALAKVSSRMSEHMDNLRRSEAEIESALGGVVSSMRIIAMVVAPLVGGMISSMSVVLADTMVESQRAKVGFGEVAAPMDPSLITLIIGAYAMESAAILVMFASDLMHGDDKVVKKFSVGMALPMSIFVFTLCAWVANALFAGIG
jgi:hypothetical protein